MSDLKVIAIAAMDEGRVIGINNSLPWDIPEDMKRFMKLTKGHTVLMGRKTFESLPLKAKPLPNRKNLIITRSVDSIPSHPLIQVCTSPESCIESCKTGEISLPSNILWVIGGEEIYKQTLPYWDEVYLTLVMGHHSGDAFFPKFEVDFRMDSEAKHDGFSYQHFIRKTQ